MDAISGCRGARATLGLFTGGAVERGSPKGYRGIDERKHAVFLQHPGTIPLCLETQKAPGEGAWSKFAGVGRSAHGRLLSLGLSSRQCVVGMAQAATH